MNKPVVMVDKMVDLRQVPFVIHDDRGIGQDIEYPSSVRRDLLVPDIGTEIQAQIIPLALDQIVKGLEVCSGGERSTHEERKHPRRFGIALDQGIGRFIDHVIHVGLGKEITQGAESGLGHDRVADVDIGNDKKSPE
jgi:hypothetical protein